MVLFKSSLMNVIVLMTFFAVCHAQCSDSFYDENSEFDVVDGVKIYPRELRCAIAGGMCVEASKCKTLVSARGLCISSFYQGVECCYEVEPQPELPCQK